MKFLIVHVDKFEFSLSVWCLGWKNIWRTYKIPFFQFQQKQWNDFLWVRGGKVHKQEHYNQHRLLFSKLHPGYHKIIHPLPSQEDKQMRGEGRILCGFVSTTLTETFEKKYSVKWYATRPLHSQHWSRKHCTVKRWGSYKSVKIFQQFGFKISLFEPFDCKGPFRLYIQQNPFP